jgi:hypothetical protein
VAERAPVVVPALLQRPSLVAAGKAADGHQRDAGD